MAFPSSPSNGDLHTEFGRTFKYSSASNSWSVATPDAPVDNTPTTQAYVDVASLPLADVIAGSKAFVEDGNRLFIFTGSGWFEIATVNTAPTITQGANASYTLTPGTPTVITLQATDPEGTPIIWGYQVTSGSLGGTTVTNVDNVFTITPGNTSASFNISFTASDGVNIDTSASSFSLTFVYDWSTGLASTASFSQLGTSSHYVGSEVAVTEKYFAVCTASGDSSVQVYSTTTSSLINDFSSRGNYLYSNSKDIRKIGIAISNETIFLGKNVSTSNQIATVDAYDIVSGTLLKTFTSPPEMGSFYNNSSYTAFGATIVVEGDYVCISAPRKNMICVFSYSSGSLLYIINPPAEMVGGSESLGWSLSVYNGVLVVGAPFDDIQPISPNGGTGDSGSVHVYDLATGSRTWWSPNPNQYGRPTLNSYFGWSVAISDQYVIVGAVDARSQNNSNVKSGTVYFFDKATGTALSDKTIEIGQEDYVGSSLAVHHATNKLYIGAENSFTQYGSIYEFDMNANVLTGYIKGNSSQGKFGRSLSVSDSYIAVGAPFKLSYKGEGFLYSRGGNLTRQTISNPDLDLADADGFGNAVAIDGDTIVVSSPNKDNSGNSNTGKVHLFNSSTGEHRLTILNPNFQDGGVNDYFGYEVGISGEYVVVRGDNSSTNATIYTFNKTTGDLLYTLTNPVDNIGSNADLYRTIAVSGDYIMVGAYGEAVAGTSSGAVYVYNIADGTLRHKISATGADQYFGDRVSGNAGIGIIGKYGVGPEVYDLNSGNLLFVAAGSQNSWTDATNEYVITSDPYFSISSNRQGRIYIYNRSGTLLRTIDNPETDPDSSGDDFGIHVKASGDILFVSAPNEFFKNMNGGTIKKTGRVYLFNITDGSLISSLNPIEAYAGWTGPSSSVPDNMRFGNYRIMSASGNKLLIGGNQGIASLYTAPIVS